MRTATELITELDQEGGNFTRCALVVGFENTSVFIWNQQLNGERLLAEAMNAGGVPAGLLGVDIHNGLLTIHSRALHEYAEEDWASEYLHNLTENMREQLLLHPAIKTL